MLRFGDWLHGELVPSVPARYRGVNGPSGRLIGARLRPATGALWLRLRPSHRPWSRVIRTLPLRAEQEPAPTPDSIDLRNGVRVYCHDGYVGRLEGVVIEPASGATLDLLVRIRSDIVSAVGSAVSPLASLLGVQGRRMLLSPAWALTTKDEGDDTLFGGGPALALDASAEQVASSPSLRSDGEIAAEILAMLDASPALSPYAGGIGVAVQDGEVTLTGHVPSPRHRASAEQDVWHVPGVFALRNELTV